MAISVPIKTHRDDLFSGNSERVSVNNPCHDPAGKGCTSSDAVEIHSHDSGVLSGYCWSCNTWYSPQEVDNIVGVTDGVLSPEMISQDMPERYVQDRLKQAKGFPYMEAWRGVSTRTMRYSGTRMRGSPYFGTLEAVLFEYYSREGIDEEDNTHIESVLSGFKVRILPKQMFVIGGTRGSKLYLQRQAEALPNKGYLIVTEGEPDALTVLETLKLKTGRWCRVVSLPTGGSIQGIINNLEFVESHSKVIFWGDNDDVGLKCIESMKELLGDKLIPIISKSGKDANDELLNGGGHDTVYEILKGAIKCK